MKSWNKLSPTLRAFFAVEGLSVVAYLIYELVESRPGESPRMSLIDGGLYFATNALGLVGFREVARRHAGRIALGFNITAVGFGVAIAIQCFWHVFVVAQPQWGTGTMEMIGDWSQFVPRFLPLLGAIIAATAGERRVAIVGAVALFVTDPVPGLGRHMYSWLSSGWHSQIALVEVLHLIELGALFAIVTRFATSRATAPTCEGTSGFRTIAAGLWLRVIAACSVTALTLLLVVGKADEGAVSLLKLATISSAVVTAISLLVIARGALGAMVADVPAAPLALAATATLWCLGVTAAQVPYTYRMLYGHESSGFFGESSRDYVDALSIIGPLVAIAALAAVASAIAGFAARRGLEQLREEAQGKGIGVVGLMLASLAVQQWLLPKADSTGTLLFMMLGAAGCSLYATVLMARLCGLAAESLGAEPGLPTATLQP